MARIHLTPAAARQLEELPISIHTRMVKLLERLDKWPDISGAKPLRGGLAGHYRLRTGDYRLQFALRGDTLIVEKIGHRDGFYED